MHALGEPGGAAGPAVAELYRRCWATLCGALRREGLGPADAEDLAQQFFLNVIDRGSLRHARLDSGCFRPYLRAAARHLAANERARARSQKRGGRVSLGPFVEDRLACRGSVTAAAPETPDQFARRRALERAWTEARDAVLGRARDEADRLRLAALLRHVDGRGDDDGRRLSAELSTSEGAARVALHRLRRRVAARLAAH